MARFSNIFGGFMATCNINGRNISVINDEIYVDGVLYVPATEAGSKRKPHGSSKMVEHKFDVPSTFNSIVAKGFTDIVFRQSDKDEDFNVSGKIPENIIDKLDVYVDHDILFITTKAGLCNGINVIGKMPTIYVTNKNLKDVSTAGSGDFTIDGDLKVANGGFAIRNSGSGDFKSGLIDTQDREATLTTSGSGDIVTKGINSQLLMVNISGSADVECGTVKTKICSIEIKGSGDVSIKGHADTVDYSIAGSGDINAGNFAAKTGRAMIAGSGDISCNVERLSERVRGSGDIHNRH